MENIEVLKEKGYQVLRRGYDGLIILYDKKFEKIAKTTPTLYKTKDDLVNGLMPFISGAQNFAIDIELFTGKEIRILFEEYRSKRPDIFGEKITYKNP